MSYKSSFLIGLGIVIGYFTISIIVKIIKYFFITINNNPLISIFLLFGISVSLVIIYWR